MNNVVTDLAEKLQSLNPEQAKRLEFLVREAIEQIEHWAANEPAGQSGAMGKPTSLSKLLPKPKGDPVQFSLSRIKGLLMWIDEHHRSFEMLHQSDPRRAESELGFLRNSMEQAILHVQRLSELIDAGGNLKHSTEQPEHIPADVWERLVKLVQQKHFGTPLL